ncbi:hypothetical protein TSTA_086710 [Talaromyces stipitatus ATCC 10500]|uniref:Uncharacterized protein n=1 Tax=Talaromyces stipitatus (strain ATCC 10500 / CBS 375.48 / QM 6759 / NRRL 1006) TaxID=441959 RepID=B8M0Q5_TALSN|nr:uncharacterized protein TSTA_086710 [Talaromyces stipitatus ATCC 10500]EED21438.1 hypothetical protein TSTA_086710 [Talaromyces stipitatus ATCC 10500]
MQFKYLFSIIFATMATAAAIIPDGCTSVDEDGPVARSPSMLDARSPRNDALQPKCPVVGISNPVSGSIDFMKM